MTRDAIAALIAQRTDALNRHDVAALCDLYAVDCTVHSPMAAGTVKGRQAIRKVYEALFDAFADISYEVERIVIEGNRVAVSGTLRGTSTGGFMGLPASGKAFTVPIVTVGLVAEGVITEERRVYDFTGLLVQAGVLRARPA